MSKTIPKTILFVVTTLKIGGAEKVFCDLVLGVRNKGFHPVVVCLKHPGYWGEYLLGHNVQLHSLGLNSRLDLFNLRKLLMISLDIRPCIIYSLDHRDAIFWSRLLAFILRSRHVLSQHSLKINGAEAKKNRLFEFINRATTPLSDRITVCGNTVKTCFVKYGFPAQKIEVIPNGISIHGPSAFVDKHSWRTKLGVPATHKVVGIVAALRPAKAHEVFLQAAAEVLRKCPRTTFVAVGEGYRRLELEKMSQELGIENNVIFTGHITPANGIMREFNVGVLSSHHEAFPLVILEYMEAQLPVVSTGSGGPSEIIVDEQTGFLVPTGDAKQMANRIIYLLNDDEMAARMGAKGRQRVEQNYSLDRMIQHNVRLFTDLAG